MRSMNKTIGIAVLILIASIYAPFFLEIAARKSNDRELSHMEEVFLQELVSHDFPIQRIESKISGESYFMLGHSRERWLESCIYSTQIELGEGLEVDPQMISTLLSDFSYEHDAQYNIHFNQSRNVLEFSKINSIPLGNFRTLSIHADNTSTLVPGRWFYPLRFYDSRCRTRMMHNGG